MHDFQLRSILKRRSILVRRETRAAAATVSSLENPLAKALAEYLRGAPALPMPMDDVSYFYRMEADRGGSE
jgi:hypothetical protein